MLVASWLVSLESENTRTAYAKNLKDFMQWLDLDRLDLLTVSRVHVDAYRQSLSGAASTVARKLAALSSFYGYAMDEAGLTANPVARVKRPKVDADASSTQGLTKEQAWDLYRVAMEDGPRSHALVALLLMGGVRISEALEATTADRGHDSGYRVLTVTRKGGKRAKIVLEAPVSHALDTYLGNTGDALELATSAPKPLFSTATGKAWDRVAAYRTIQRLAKQAGIEGNISPHSMRHTFATLHLDAGGTLHDLQDTMGHSDPRTTRRYDRARGNLAKSATRTVANALEL